MYHIFFSLCIAWYGFLDTEAIAEGKITPVGEVKIIQSLVAGHAERILIKEGETVKEGQLLIQLNEVESMADVHALQSSLLYYKLNESRLRCLIRAIMDDDPLPLNLKSWLKDHPELISNSIEETLRTQQQQLDFDHALFLSNDQSLKDAIRQREASINAIQAEIDRYNLLLPIYKDQESSIKYLYKKSHASRMEWLNVKEKEVSESQKLHVEKNRLIEARALLASTVSERDKQKFTFLQSRVQQINDYSDKIEELTQALRKSIQRQMHSKIFSPINGTVQRLELHYEGAIVEAAKPLMIIVPDESELQVEAAILNKDIGFIHTGMTTDIKIQSFPYTFYGYLTGTVKQISRDAIASHDEGLVYTAFIQIDRQSIIIEKKKQSLQAGMMVTVEIKTGKRRVLEFFIEPFFRYKDEAFNVR